MFFRKIPNCFEEANSFLCPCHCCSHCEVSEELSEKGEDENQKMQREDLHGSSFLKVAIRTKPTAFYPR